MNTSTSNPIIEVLPNETKELHRHDKAIKEAKDYQLQSCMNRMNQLSKDCSDNLTGELTRSIKYKCQSELESRGITPDLWT